MQGHEKRDEIMGKKISGKLGGEFAVVEREKRLTPQQKKR